MIMLVLSRKIGEQIYVPQFEILLTVLAVNGQRVSLGITAPKGINIVRQELLDCLPKPSASLVTTDFSPPAEAAFQQAERLALPNDGPGPSNPLPLPTCRRKG
jgi:carbon storage regulator